MSGSKLEDYIFEYSKKVFLHNQLIDYYDNKVEACCKHLGRILSIKESFLCAEDWENKECCEKALKNATSEYITVRKSLENINNHINLIAGEISQLEQAFNKKQLRKLQETLNLKEKTYINNFISKLNKEIEEMHYITGYDKNGYPNKKYDILGIISNKDLIRVIETEFDLTQNGNYQPKKIFDEQTK